MESLLNMKKHTIACSPSIYKDIIPPNIIDLNNSHSSHFSDQIHFYKRGSFHPNNIALQKILLNMYGIINNTDGQIIITSSCVAAAILIAKSNIFNHILYDSHINPEMIEAFSVNGNAYKLEHFSQIQNNDIVCIESYSLPSCECNFNKIQLLIDYAHQRGAYILVDNSCITGYVWNPLVIGADFCVESLAKTANGYNNSLLGFLLINPLSLINIKQKTELLDSIRYFGFYPHPIDCYLTILGLQTLPLRLDQIYKTTDKICTYLNTNNVKYTAIREGGLVFIKIPSTFDILILNNCKLFQSAGVFGANYSIIDKMEKFNLLRLSIGLEDFDDLLNDLIFLCSHINE